MLEKRRYLMDVEDNIDSESNTDSTRKLASIQIVEKVEKHSGADSLEIVTILGWQIITKVGETSVGSKVIYCEIDSMLPHNAPWLPEAIKDRIIKEKLSGPFRVRTIKLRGELSQGLIIPLATSLPIGTDTLEIGHDVTELLAIEKYDPPAITGKGSLFQSRTAGNLPSHLINKTDEYRVQSCPEFLQDLAGEPYYMTVKMDGVSATYLINPETRKLMVCSRNMIRERPINTSLCPYWSVAVKHDIENKLKVMPHIAIQGEICGPKIQKNLAMLKEFSLFVFNVVNLNTKQRYPLDNMMFLCSDILNVPTVPLYEQGDCFNYYDVYQLLNKAKGTYAGTKNAREGLVIRSADQSISFKVINNDYLLKHGF